ncbi:MAG: AbgT family transporter [Bryobacterales bacterium]|nr:AbgT family transporter [Bryobacterales bacterium]
MPERRTAIARFLDFVEWAGNKLPHPATLFALFAGLVLVLSWLAAGLQVSAVLPGSGKTVAAVNLLSGDGARRIVTSLVTNFTGFVPLGTVLVAMLGVGVAEGSGLLGAFIRALVLSSPKRLITWVVVFAGVLSNAASEAGYVILIPLAAIVFQGFGRHPMAGLAAAFAGVSGGYSANLVLGTVDPLLSGISTEAARLIDPAYSVNPAANYYFMFASTFLITVAGSLVTDYIVEPRLGKADGPPLSMERLSAGERRGLIWAGITGTIFTVLLVLAVVPEGAILRDPQTGGLLHSPFLSGIVTIIALAFFIPGLAYGMATGKFRGDNDVMEAMSKTMSTLGGYIVLVFFAAQFVAFFGWTNLGTIFAIRGAEFLKAVGLTGLPLILSFIVVAALLNLFMGSASAKWAIMAPVFVPMFMLLGYTPEVTQAAYRIGDSTTNVVTPMMSYFALIVAFAQKHKKDAGIGTIIATMLPYSLAFLAAWALMLLIWLAADLPVGPGAGIRLG